MTVAGYYRVSTEQQKEDESHIRQKKKLQNWAENNDKQIELYGDIAISGKSDNRKQYQKLMNQVEKYDAVVVRELSRFGRDLQTVLKDVEKLKKKNVDFISIKEDFNTDSAMGKAMLQMIGVFNEFWANIARERALENVEQRRKEGKSIGRPKKLPEPKIKELVQDKKDKDLSYSALAKIYQEFTDDGNLDRSTVKRYCDNRIEN